MEDARQALDKWADETPWLTRALSISLTVGSVLGLATGLWPVCVPSLVMEGEVHRLVLSVFSEGHPIGILVSLIWVNRSMKRQEEEFGSTNIAMLLLQLAVSINVVYCALMVMLAGAVGAPQLMLIPSQGLFPTILAMLIVNKPEGRMSIPLVPFSMEPKHVPFAIIGISFLLSGSIPLDLLCSLLVSYGYKKITSSSATTILPLFQSASMTLGSSQMEEGSTGEGNEMRRPSREKILHAAESRIKQQGPEG